MRKFTIFKRNGRSSDPTSYVKKMREVKVNNISHKEIKCKIYVKVQKPIITKKNAPLDYVTNSQYNAHTDLELDFENSSKVHFHPGLIIIL